MWSSPSKNLQHKREASLKKLQAYVIFLNKNNCNVKYEKQIFPAFPFSQGKLIQNGSEFTVISDISWTLTTGQTLSKVLYLKKRIESFQQPRRSALSAAPFSDSKCITSNMWYHVRAITQSCLTLCDPLDCSAPTRLLCPWDPPGKSSGVGCRFLPQEIFRIQGSNPHLLHWQEDSSPSGKTLWYQVHGNNISFICKISDQRSWETWSRSHSLRDAESGFELRTSSVAQRSRICLQCKRHRRHKFSPKVGKIPWRRKW